MLPEGVVEKRAIITVPSEFDCLRLWAEPLGQVKGRLGDALLQEAGRWLRVKKLEGYEYIAAHDIHVYGPYPSAVRLESYLSEEHMSVTEEDMSGLIRESADSADAFSQYLLNAHFLAAPAGVLSKGVA